MMNKLQTVSAISKEKLNKAQWFQSFLREAARQRLLSEAELHSIQEQTMQLMVYLATRYTAGASTSVREETAQGLMACAAYSIGHALKSMPLDAALHDLKSVPLKMLFDRGQAALRTLLADTKAQYAALLKSGMPLCSVTWQSTMHTGLAEFFAGYNVYDAAHDTPGLLDYPTALPMDGAGGIEYISRYVKRLMLEDSLIRRWPPDEVNGLIRAGGAGDAPVNVFLLVLTNALGAVLCGRQPAALSLTRDDRDTLRDKLTNAPLHRTLRAAADVLCKALAVQDKALCYYMSDAAALLAPAVKTALNLHTLQRVFLTIKSAAETVFFHDAPRMDDKLFRALVTQIEECDDPADRAELVTMNAASIADIVDLFDTGILTSGDIRLVLNTLGDKPLAALLSICRESAPDALHTSDTELAWRSALKDHLASMEAQKQRRIRDMALHLEFI